MSVILAPGLVPGRGGVSELEFKRTELLSKLSNWGREEEGERERLGRETGREEEWGKEEWKEGREGREGERGREEGETNISAIKLCSSCFELQFAHTLSSQLHSTFYSNDHSTLHSYDKNLQSPTPWLMIGTTLPSSEAGVCNGISLIPRIFPCPDEYKNSRKVVRVTVTAVFIFCQDEGRAWVLGSTCISFWHLPSGGEGVQPVYHIWRHLSAQPCYLRWTVLRVDPSAQGLWWPSYHGWVNDYLM